MSGDLRIDGEVAEAFIEYLAKRGLSICNFSKNIKTFWPIDTDSLAMGFATREG